MKLVIITYYWPPSGGAGVQRWVKFAKYLPEYGWEPYVITVDPDYAAYPVIDETLENEVIDKVNVFRTRALDYFALLGKDKSKIPSAGFANNADDSFKGKISQFLRGNLFIPDPRKGWNKYAFRKACKLIREHGISYIITTSPPHSTQLIGLKLKNKFPGIKWISDLRDPWTDIYYYDQFYPTFLSKFIDKKLERRVLERSDHIITVGQSLRNLFSMKVPDVEKKITVISNGYDNEDFNTPLPEDSGEFIITYAGTLSGKYNINGFLRCIKELENKGIELKIRFIGSVQESQKELLDSHNTSISFIPYSDHSTTIRYMRESSLLLLIIPDHPSNKSIITGKLFEYLAAGKPILCIGPVEGDAAMIISETGHGITCTYNDHEKMTSYILKVFNKEVPDKAAPKEYSRSENTRKLVHLLR
ncbi:MAG TPA: glycosyltransferase family 4 protein [Bacteroidales bacterium]|nr:glycosyltransferase family 4 protein [Bacteroidales bacterium]